MFIITLWKFMISWCFVFPSEQCILHNHDARVTQYLRYVCTYMYVFIFRYIWRLDQLNQHDLVAPLIFHWIALKELVRWITSPMSIESWIVVAVSRMVFRVGRCLLNNTIDHSPLKILIFEIYFRMTRSVVIWILILRTNIDVKM